MVSTSLSITRMALSSRRHLLNLFLPVAEDPGVDGQERSPPRAAWRRCAHKVWTSSFTSISSTRSMCSFGTTSKRLAAEGVTESSGNTSRSSAPPVAFPRYDIAHATPAQETESTAANLA
eukprot:CAMPEP_0117494464 /NCGR_PEP_ID=MMETSP0784-20121206/19624_1 /TAXON_ID=39447 /ORGANISM="" /LENGTH=119 /DNA_ID=CAMNT_0005289343 /DNA_START=133 /DNA_END=488 /DNA_ORIENTATION=+